MVFKQKTWDWRENAHSSLYCMSMEANDFPVEISKIIYSKLLGIVLEARLWFTNCGYLCRSEIAIAFEIELIKQNWHAWNIHVLPSIWPAKGLWPELSRNHSDPTICLLSLQYSKWKVTHSPVRWQRLHSRVNRMAGTQGRSMVSVQGIAPGSC